MKTKRFKIKLDFVSILLIASMVLLAVFGVVMVYGASCHNAELNYGNKFFYMTKQIVGVVLGLAGMTLCYFVDYHKFAKWKNMSQE